MRRVLGSSRADLRTCDYDLCSSLRRRPDAAGIQLPGYSAALGLISPEFYYITATDTSLISDLEHSLRITCCYRLLPLSELLVTALLSIYDVSVIGQALDFPGGKHADSCDS